MEQGNWEVAYVVLVPGGVVKTPQDRRNPFSKEVSEALLACAPNLGTFSNQDAWQSKPDLAFTTGKVQIGGNTFYQYKTHHVKWRLILSNTGRGYRIAGFQARAFGAISKVPTGGGLSATISVGYQPSNREAEKAARLTFSPLALDSIKARCSNGRLRITGPSATLTDGGWREAIQGQPFNAVVDVFEEVSR